ncbi:MAG: carbohydrate ABC transporter permease [Clostridia bacterium]|nr:carbohydrate ABC transporter permease [Clostridia bacterium]
MKKIMSKREPKPIFSHLFFIAYMLICIIPFLLLVSISFSNENDVLNKGFSLIPENFTTEAYTHILSDITTLLRAYGVTAISAFGGAILSITVMAALGYTLARPHFIFKKFLSIVLIITMFFHGGLVPSYIINTQVFHLGNSIWIYLVNGMVSAYTVFVFRTFFAQIPTSLIEAAELDGASEMQLLTKVILPLSTAVIATYTFMQIVARWNDFSVTMYYIQDTELYTLQYLLQQILNEAKFLAELKKTMPLGDMTAIPSETLKYAMCVLASAPMLFVFPFFQRYFSKGMVVGAVKG